MELQDLYQLFKRSTGIAIDSRNVQHGNIFFALRGEHTDGNIFAEAALAKGALCAVTDDPALKNSEKIFSVNDSLLTLQELAAMHRDTLTIPLIAITGSNGKTTTKELTEAVLQKKYKPFATRGNLNNHIGVPLSILSVTEEHTIALIEMGANHQQEISFLCNIAKPGYGLITNIGKAHLEGFGGEEGVKKGKSELYNYIMQHGGVVFANSGQQKLKDVYEKYATVVHYGFHDNDFIAGSLLESLPFATIQIQDVVIESNLVGQYNAENILAAACIGKYFGVALPEIKTAIEAYVPKNSRSEWKEINSNHFILDAYNANPSSMQAAIQNFMQLDVNPKIAILGDMLEMGEFAASEHLHILELALQGNFHEIMTVGKEFLKAAKDHKQVIAFENTEEARSYFVSKNFQGAYILLKGSRGIALEKILT